MITVTMQVERRIVLDVTPVLDRWTLQEVQDFVDDDDAEGMEILESEGVILDSDSYRRLDYTGLDNYLDDRERNL